MLIRPINERVKITDSLTLIVQHEVNGCEGCHYEMTMLCQETEIRKELGECCSLHTGNDGTIFVECDRSQNPIWDTSARSSEHYDKSNGVAK